MHIKSRTLIVFILLLTTSLGCQLAQPIAAPARQATSTSIYTAVPPTQAAQTARAQAATHAARETRAALPTATPPPADTPLAETPKPLPTPPALPFDFLSAGDPYSPELGNTGYDVQRYTLALTLDPAWDFIQGRVTLTATATAAIDRLSLDFVGFEVERVSYQGQEIAATRSASKLLVSLPSPLAQGQTFTLEIAYSGEQVREASAYAPFAPHIGLIRPDNQSLFVASEPDGSRYWYPCNDHPRDKATYRFELTVPQGMTGVANGTLIGEPQPVPQAFPQGKDGMRYTWEHNFPTASAFVTVAVAAYERIEGRSPNGIRLRSYVFPDQVARFQTFQEPIGEMIDWLSELFGPYPFEEFGYVTVRGMGASLETQTMVVLDTAMLDETTLVHEMAHMWFGDWVSLDSWGEIWRSEGFATYTQYLWPNRHQPDQLEAEMLGIEDYIRANPSGYPLNDPPRAEMFGRDSYIKGAVVAHALRQEIGEAAFYAGLRTYFDRYGGGTASQAQFQQVMEEASAVDLDAFFQEWLE